MDPITATFAVVTVINTLSQAYSISNKLSQTQIRKRDHLQDELKMEHRRTLRWAKRVGALSREELAVVIPKGDGEEVLSLTIRLERAYKAASKQLDRYNRVSNKTAKGIAARLKLASGGYEEMKDLIAAIKTMNIALYDLAPPFPPDYHSTTTTRDSFARVSDARVMNATAGRALHISGNLDNLGMDATEPLRPRGFAIEVDAREEQGFEYGSFEDEALGSILRDLESVLPLSPGTTLKELFNLALSALQAIAKSTGSRPGYTFVCRIKSWGYGLFDSVASIETVLAIDQESDMFIAELIRKSFIKIIVLEVQAITNLLGMVDATTKLELQNLQLELKQILAKDENISFALEFSRVVLKDSVTLFGLGLNDEETGDTEIEGFSGQIIHSIGEIVELLFALQPTLRAIRQGWCLQRERTMQQPNLSRSNLVATGEPAGSTLASAPRSESDTARKVAPGQESRSQKMLLSPRLNMQLLDIGTAVRLRDAKIKQNKGPALQKAVDQCLKAARDTPEEVAPHIKEAINAFLEDLKLRDNKMEKIGPQSKNTKEQAELIRTIELYGVSGTELQLDDKTDLRIDTLTQRLARLSG